jgi:hypothetical protein
VFLAVTAPEEGVIVADALEAPRARTDIAATPATTPLLMNRI